MHKLQCALRTRTRGGGVWGHAPSGKFGISGLLKSSLMRFLGNMAETCCELAIVCRAVTRPEYARAAS